MPFKSDAQRKLCYYLQGKGQAGSWDCDQWSKETKGKKLPEHVDDKKTSKKAGIQKLSECLSSIKKDLVKASEDKPDKLPGGAGDNKKPSDFPADAVHKGVLHELEHTTDKGIAQEITLDHLTEDQEYYKKLEKIENDSEDKKDKKEDKNQEQEDKLASAVKLAQFWARKAAEVTASPGRGPGDTVANVTDLDPTEGLPKPKVKEEKTTGRPVNRKFSMPAARKALRAASKEVLGTDPSGGQQYGPVINKEAQIGSALSGAGSSLGDAFRGTFMGDQEAVSRLQQSAKAPNYSAMQKGINALAEVNPFKGVMNAAAPVARAGTQATAQQISNIANSDAARNWASSHPMKAFKIMGAVNKLKPVANYATNLASGLEKSYGQAKAQAAESEGKRMTAQYALPVMEFLNKNPWAKWLLGIGAAGVGLYGLGGLGRSMFGGGQPNYGGYANPLQASFHQGYGAYPRYNG